MMIPANLLGLTSSEANDDSCDGCQSELITLDLSGEHTEAAALEPVPMQVLAHRFHPPEKSDLINLNLDSDQEA
jgi:hypothetical protein